MRFDLGDDDARSLSHTDQKYIQTFMLTFRSFTSPLEFLSLLKRRFYLEPLPGQSNEEFESGLRFVRTRITNVLKHWIQKSFFDFQEDEQLRNEMLLFLNNDFLQHVEPAARQLLKLFDKQVPLLLLLLSLFLSVPFVFSAQTTSENQSF